MVERILPRDFPVAPEFVIPLSNVELQELGTFTAIWSQIDHLILSIIQELTGADFGTLQLIMENMTTGPRVNLLSKLCLRDPNPIKREIKKLCDNNGGLIEDRNHIVHGLWAVRWDYASGVTAASCLYQKNKRDELSAGRLIELSNRAAKFSHDLGKAIEKINPARSGPRPRLFLFGKGSPVGYAPPPWPPESQL